ncbi:MAG: MFS transporter [Chlamydiales bacterium]
MASDWTDAELSFLWTLNFFLSTGVVALYGWVVTRIRFDRLVPTVYGFFAASFFMCSIEITGAPHYHVWFNKSFYVWVSIFSLFNISVFWSFMSDLYTKEQAGRLFPIIGAGASAGALIGPSIPTLLSEILGTQKLLYISSSLIVLVIPIVLFLQSSKQAKERSDFLEPINLSQTRIGGNPFAGFRDFLTNRYLMAIGVFIVLYTAISSILYFQQKNLLAVFDLAERTQILGGVDWIVNILTFVIAFFATGRLIEYFGASFTLSSVPFAMFFGLSIVVFSPVLIIVLILQVLRRAGNYAITRPAREMLFTLVDREQRFKAKPVIDIVAYRGGDMITSWGFAALTQGLGYGLSATAIAGAIITLFWGILGIYLGKRFHQSQ